MCGCGEGISWGSVDCDTGMGAVEADNIPEFGVDRCGESPGCWRSYTASVAFSQGTSDCDFGGRVQSVLDVDVSWGGGVGDGVDPGIWAGVGELSCVCSGDRTAGTVLGL